MQQSMFKQSAAGTEDEQLETFRHARDEIRSGIDTYLSHQGNGEFA